MTWGRTKKMLFFSRETMLVPTTWTFITTWTRSRCLLRSGSVGNEVMIYVLHKRNGIKTKHHGVERSFSSWIARILHRHRYLDRYRGVVATYIKGLRERVQAIGTYQECGDCGRGRFVPDNRVLSVVGCTKDLARWRLSRPRSSSRDSLGENFRD